MARTAGDVVESMTLMLVFLRAKNIDRSRPGKGGTRWGLRGKASIAFDLPRYSSDDYLEGGIYIGLPSV